MRIGINSRIYQNKNTGIPNYVRNLFQTIIGIDKVNSYVFFQTNNKKTIGSTRLIKGSNNLLSQILFDLFRVNSLAKSEKINIFHGPSHILPFFTKNDISYVLTVHDLAFFIYPQYYSKIFILYYRYILKRSLKNADKIIAVSNNTKADIIKFYMINPDKIEVIYPGIDPLFFEPLREERMIKEKYFFSVTTHPKRKNIINVLKALENNLVKGYKYVIAGKISDDQLINLNTIIESFELQNRVVILGFVTDLELKNLYSFAEFFIYPSFYEGFGLPVLEAMICSCPVITSNNSSLIEVMQNKDFLIDPHKTQDIIEKINLIINLKDNEREELIKQNYRFASQFTWEKSAQDVLKIYNYMK